MKTYIEKIPEITLKYKSGDEFKSKISSSQDAFNVFMKFYDTDVFELTESVIVLFLNGANNTVGWQKHSQGGTNQTVVDVKLILTTALKCGAISLMLSHNHPSGQLRPSFEDENITKRLKEGCNYLGLKFLDHIICTTGGYYSFADEGKL